MESVDEKTGQGTDLLLDGQICESLKPEQKCFRLRQYSQGKFHDLFHEHVQRHRISEVNAINFMRTLVARYSNWNDLYILRLYLNDRGKKPPSAPPFQMPVCYPEPGVIRRYCSCGDVAAWMDEVIPGTKFRTLK